MEAHHGRIVWLGLAWVLLRLYGAFGVFASAFVLGVFNFVEGLLAGAIIAVLISLFGPKGVKVALGMFGVAFVGFNVFAITHYHLSGLTPATRLFCSVDGLLIGLLLTLAGLSWLTDKRPEGESDQLGSRI